MSQAVCRCGRAREHCRQRTPQRFEEQKQRQKQYQRAEERKGYAAQNRRVQAAVMGQREDANGWQREDGGRLGGDRQAEGGESSGDSQQLEPWTAMPRRLNQIERKRQKERHRRFAEEGLAVGVDVAGDCRAQRHRHRRAIAIIQRAKQQVYQADRQGADDDVEEPNGVDVAQARDRFRQLQQGLRQANMQVFFDIVKREGQGVPIAQDAGRRRAGRFIQQPVAITRQACHGVEGAAGISALDARAVCQQVEAGDAAKEQQKDAQLMRAGSAEPCGHRGVTAWHHAPLALERASATASNASAMLFSWGFGSWRSA